MADHIQQYVNAPGDGIRCMRCGQDRPRYLDMRPQDWQWACQEFFDAHAHPSPSAETLWRACQAHRQTLLTLQEQRQHAQDALFVALWDFITAAVRADTSPPEILTALDSCRAALDNDARYHLLGGHLLQLLNIPDADDERPAV